MKREKNGRNSKDLVNNREKTVEIFVNFSEKLVIIFFNFKIVEYLGGDGIFRGPLKFSYQLLNTIILVFYYKICYHTLKLEYSCILGYKMTKGKKVKAIDSPSFDASVNLENIGNFIKARRTQQKLSTQDTALLCNISAHTLNKIENGFEGVKFGTLLSVMDALGIKLHISPWDDTHA